MWIYLILFLIICVVIVMSSKNTSLSTVGNSDIEKLLLNKKKKKERYRNNKKQRVYERFDVSASNMDAVLDYYCSTNQPGKDNYLGYWDNEEIPKCVSTSCTNEICHELVQTTTYPGITHLYEYNTISSNMIKTNRGCESRNNPSSNILCGESNAPTCSPNSNIEAYFYDPITNWTTKTCRFMFDSNGNCVLRDMARPFPEVKIVDLINPLNIIYGNSNASITYYNISGPKCDLSWDGYYLRDDAGNIINIASNNLDPINPVYNHPAGALNYALCENNQTMAYVHPEGSSGMYCEFAGDCSSCEYGKESCYTFDSTSRTYDKKNFIHTFLDTNPSDSSLTETCGTYLVNSNATEAVFTSTDYSEYSQCNLYNILNHGNRVITMGSLTNCANTKGAECSATNIHTCRLYDPATKNFYNQQYKEIYDSTGNACEYCKVGDSNCFFNTKSNTDCPDIKCPTGMNVVYGSGGVAQSCAPCDYSTHYYSMIEEGCKPFSQCAAGRFIGNTILSNIDVNDPAHVHTIYAHEFIASNDDPNKVSLSDITCSQCPINSYTVTQNSLLACTPCDEGEYTSNIGATSCVPCANGSYRSNGMVLCEACGVYHVPNLLKSACINCASSYKVPNSDRTECVTCGVNTTFNIAQSNCRTLCDSSNYWNVDGNNCLPIPGGKFKTLDTTIPSATLDVLNNCVAGYYRSNGMPGLACTICPTGTHSAEGASRCITCANNAFWNGSNCVACTSNGQVINLTKTGCTMCDSNLHKTNNSGHTECVCMDEYHTHPVALTCVKCSNQQYWDTATYACEDCAEGYVGSNQEGSQYCDPCPTNTYRSNGMTTCRACPIGSYSMGGASRCTTCSNNSYWDSNSGICRRCPDGKIGSGGIGIESCENCPIHYFRSGAMLNCSNCVTGLGYYTTSTGASNCEYCGYGSSYDNGECSSNLCSTLTEISATNPATGTLYCLDCLDAGKIANKVTNTCKSCPANSTAQSNNTCLCNTGYFMKTNADGSSACVYCGTASNMLGMYWDGDSCEYCAPGMYSTGTGCSNCGANAVVDPSDRTQCMCSSSNYHMSNDGINCFTCDNVAGYVYDSANNECDLCDSVLGFQLYVSNDSCVVLPPNSVRDPTDRTRYECIDGYFLDPTDGSCDLCEGPRKYWDAPNDQCTFCVSNEFVYSNDGMGTRCASCGAYSGVTTDPATGVISCQCLDPSIPQDYLYMNSDGLSCAYCNPLNRKYWSVSACETCPNQTHFIDSNDAYTCKPCRSNAISTTNPFACYCMSNFINNANNECVCEGSDRILLANGTCQMCGVNQFARSNQCVICGANAQRKATTTTCECVARPGSNPAYFHLTSNGLSCVYCDNTKGHYWDSSAFQCRSNCSTSQRIVNDVCTNCPMNAIADSNNYTRCVCSNQFYNTGTGTDVICAFCNTDAHKYYDSTSNICKFCDSNAGYYVNSMGNGCIRCGSNTIYNNTYRRCECDYSAVSSSERIYYHMDRNGINCIKCDNRSNQRWDDINKTCIRPSGCSNNQFITSFNTCQNCGQHEVVDPTDTTQCVCKPNFTSNIYGQCECDSNDRFTSNGVCIVCPINQVVYQDPSGVKSCRLCGTNASYSNRTCVCNTNSYKANLNDLSCVYCDPNQGNYWTGRECLPCSSSNKIVPIGDGTFICEACPTNEVRGSGFNDYSNCYCLSPFYVNSSSNCVRIQEC